MPLLKLQRSRCLNNPKTGAKRTTHQHLFLPKDYSGSPTTSIYTPWTDEEAEAYLTTGWGEVGSTKEATKSALDNTRPHQLSCCYR